MAIIQNSTLIIEAASIEGMIIENLSFRSPGTLNNFFQLHIFITSIIVSLPEADGIKCNDILYKITSCHEGFNIINDTQSNRSSLERLRGWVSILKLEQLTKSLVEILGITKIFILYSDSINPKSQRCIDEIKYQILDNILQLGYDISIKQKD
jgi:hypothetical protein